MSVYSGPEVVQNGLVFAYDMGNVDKSWKGAPTTNLYQDTFGSTGTLDGFGGGSFLDTNISSDLPFGKGIVYARKSNSGVATWSVQANLTAGVTYTYSIWCKTVAWTSVSMRRNEPSVYVAESKIVSVTPGVWSRVSFTFTVSVGKTGVQAVGIGVGDVNPGMDNRGIFLYGAMLEQQSFATPYTNTSRSNTQAILDLAGLNTITATSLTYNSNNTFSFNGTTNKIYQSSIPASYTAVSNLLPRSWEAIVRPATNLAYAAIFGHKVGAGCSYFCNGGLYIYNSKFTFNWWDNSNYFFLDSGITAAANQTYHVVGTFNPSDLKNRIYVNGVLYATSSATNMNYGGGIYESNIGWNSKNEFGGGGGSDDYFNGIIPIARYYSNKILSDSEIRQNFNALRGRFGI